MAKGKNKGTKFERLICKQLSLWWTNNKSEDIFWRTAGSGAMASIRTKKGKKTFGQYSDVQATNPIGQPLIDLCTIELKRGYSKSTFADLVEPSTHTNPKPCQYEKFIQQAIDDYKHSDSKTWLLIIKRDRKETIILMPFILYKKLKEQNIKFRAPYFHLHYIYKRLYTMHIFGCTLNGFLLGVKPSHIKKIVRGFHDTSK